jgi:outer membrane protein insertion porin family
MRPHREFPTNLAIASFGIFVLLLVPNNAQAQYPKRLVETLEIQGNRRLRDEDILPHIKTRPGEAYSDEQVQRDLQSIIELGVFDATQTKVTIEAGVRGGVVVIFEVDELPLILSVTFKGLRGVEEPEVIQALHENKINLVKDGVYNPAKIRVAMRVIREFLASRGWLDAAITVREEIGGTYASIEFLIGDEK